MKTSLPSASNTADRRRFGRGETSFLVAVALRAGFSTCSLAITGATMTFTAIVEASSRFSDASEEV